MPPPLLLLFVHYRASFTLLPFAVSRLLCPGFEPLDWWLAVRTTALRRLLSSVQRNNDCLYPIFKYTTISHGDKLPKSTRQLFRLYSSSCSPLHRYPPIFHSSGALLQWRSEGGAGGHLPLGAGSGGRQITNQFTHKVLFHKAMAQSGCHFRLEVR